ncbi:MAG: hypothetical protein FJ304_14990 [Planctomycetes bacterium]|nr:hypothetical protein [Planctomycetota bacterium]
MHPLLKRILIHGAFTAGVLALVGALFAELAGMWAAGHTGKPGSADLNPTLPSELGYRVPLTLGVGGFLFVAVCEGGMAWLRSRRPPPAPPPAPAAPDEAEKLLNELLAQAEAKRAAEGDPPPSPPAA